MLSLDQIDNITAQKHLCLGVTVLEKLLLSNFKLVAKQIDQCIVETFEKFHVIEMNYILVNAVGKHKFSD